MLRTNAVGERGTFALIARRRDGLEMILSSERPGGLGTLSRDLWLSTLTIRSLLSGWQMSGVVVAMSGLPIDVVDAGAGSFFGLANAANSLSRPQWAEGAAPVQPT